MRLQVQAQVPVLAWVQVQVLVPVWVLAQGWPAPARVQVLLAQAPVPAGSKDR
jgi:hypothetical protein